MKKLLSFWLYPPVNKIRQNALEQAQRELEMQTMAVEYHSHMVAMYKERIKRLERSDHEEV